MENKKDNLKIIYENAKTNALNTSNNNTEEKRVDETPIEKPYKVQRQNYLKVNIDDITPYNPFNRRKFVKETLNRIHNAKNEHKEKFNEDFPESDKEMTREALLHDMVLRSALFPLWKKAKTVDFETEDWTNKKRVFKHLPLELLYGTSPSEISREDSKLDVREKKQ